MKKIDKPKGIVKQDAKILTAALVFKGILGDIKREIRMFEKSVSDLEFVLKQVK
jgi:hypothetical protein